ncbi:hypothetical protein Hanom_Chr01g00079001 [Helianthus anomalus]
MIMTTMEEDICLLLDSYWYKHHILTSNPPTVSDTLHDQNECMMKNAGDDAIIALTTITDYQSDVEMKGLLRFWAHSVASTVS